MVLKNLESWIKIKPWIAEASVAAIKVLSFGPKVPKPLLDKKILEKHFSQFGTVVKVVVSATKENAFVHFDSHDAAKSAKENGVKVSPKLPNIGAIFFGKSKII